MSRTNDGTNFSTTKLKLIEKVPAQKSNSPTRQPHKLLVPDWSEISVIAKMKTMATTFVSALIIPKKLSDIQL